MRLIEIIVSAFNFLTQWFRPHQIKVDPKRPSWLVRSIDKGKNYCNERCFVAVRTKALTFKVLFNKTVIYQIADYNQQDENKLMGFTDDNQFNGHRFSARFGWDWYEDKLNLSAYVYNLGIREVKELCSVPLNQEITLAIHVFAGKYTFVVDGTEYDMPRMASGEYARGCLENFYWGGGTICPQDINILVMFL